MKNWKTIFIALGTGLLIGLAFLAFTLGIVRSMDALNLGNAPELLEEPKDNPFLGVTLANLSTGDTIVIGEQPGLAFMNFWAIWCPPCVRELPSIEQLYQDRKEEMAFYLITLDEPAQLGKTFAEDKGYSFPVYAPVGELPESAWAGGGIPLSLLTRADKALIYHFGSADWNSSRVHRLLDNLRAEPMVDSR